MFEALLECSCRRSPFLRSGWVCECQVVNCHGRYRTGRTPLARPITCSRLRTGQSSVSYIDVRFRSTR